MSEVAEREQKVIDLRKQIQELKAEDPAEWVFQTIPSPGRKPMTLYSLMDGEPITLPRYIARSALSTGRFTTKKEDAPEYVLGTVKCFLHPESTYRETGLLDKAGVSGTVCHSAHLASKYAMEEVARSKHRKQWMAVQAVIADEKEAAAASRQERQVEATLALAGRAAEAPIAQEKCSDCDFTGSAAQLRGHRMGAHRKDVSDGTDNRPVSS